MRTRPNVIPPPFGAIESHRTQRSRYLVPGDIIAHGTRQPIPVIAEGEHIDWAALDIPTVTRESAQGRLDEAVVIVRDTLEHELGLERDVADRVARQVVQGLAGRIR
jgi:hypothetical protein